MKTDYALTIYEYDGVWFVDIPEYGLKTEGFSLLDALEMAIDAIMVNRDDNRRI